MKKAAVFAAAMLGFASAAQAVTVDFSGLGLSNFNQVQDQPQGANNYSLDYSANARFWDNQGGSDVYYAPTANPAIVDVAYVDSFGGTFSVAINAAPGFEILLDSFRLVRPGSGGGENDNTTVIIDGLTNDKSEGTVFSATHVFNVDYTGSPATRARGTSVTLSFADGTAANLGDFGLDQYSFTVQAIPEPTVLAPMALAGMGMFLRRRRA